MMICDNDSLVMIEIPQTVAGAIEVMNNIHGVGRAREESLRNAGYDPFKVQKLVNVLVEYWGD